MPDYQFQNCQASQQIPNKHVISRVGSRTKNKDRTFHPSPSPRCETQPSMRGMETKIHDFVIVDLPIQKNGEKFFPSFFFYVYQRVYQNFRGSSSLCSMAMAAMAGGWSDSKLPEAQSPRSVRTPSQGCGSLRVLVNFTNKPTKYRMEKDGTGKGFNPGWNHGINQKLIMIHDISS